MLSIFLSPYVNRAPELEPKPPIPKFNQLIAANCEEIFDFALVQYFKDRRNEPDRIWSPINSLIRLERHRSREKSRRWRLFAAERVKILLKCKVLKRHRRKFICLSAEALL